MNAVVYYISLIALFAMAQAERHHHAPGDHGSIFDHAADLANSILG